MSAKTCDYCQAKNAPNACSACLNVFYCGEVCSEKGWDQSHKYTCGDPQPISGFSDTKQKMEVDTEYYYAVEGIGVGSRDHPLYKVYKELAQNLSGMVMSIKDWPLKVVRVDFHTGLDPQKQIWLVQYNPDSTMVRVVTMTPIDSQDKDPDYDGPGTLNLRGSPPEAMKSTDAYLHALELLGATKLWKRIKNLHRDIAGLKLELKKTLYPFDESRYSVVFLDE